MTERPSSQEAFDLYSAYMCEVEEVLGPQLDLRIHEEEFFQCYDTMEDGKAIAFVENIRRGFQADVEETRKKLKNILRAIERGIPPPQHIIDDVEAARRMLDWRPDMN